MFPGVSSLESRPVGKDPNRMEGGYVRSKNGRERGTVVHEGETYRRQEGDRERFRRRRNSKKEERDTEGRSHLFPLFFLLLPLLCTHSFGSDNTEWFLKTVSTFTVLHGLSLSFTTKFHPCTQNEIFSFLTSPNKRR